MKGITHVGIYVGNNMMLHAGDPVGLRICRATNGRRKSMPLADCPSSRECSRMSEPKKRYPADRIKLHALLDKKENELRRLTEEVNQLRARVKEADRTAINATCELYALTPEMLSAFLRTKFGTQDNAPEIPAAPQLPEGENE